MISGNWAAGQQAPIKGGFRFIELKREKIDAQAVNALAREEMIDLLLTSYWDKSEKAKSYLRRLPIGKHQLLFATNPKNEGFFLVWADPEAPLSASSKSSSGIASSILNREVFKAIVREAQEEKLALRYHVYASLAPYTGPGIEFYKIPDKVLEQIGFSAKADAFNNAEAADA